VPWPSTACGSGKPESFAPAGVARGLAIRRLRHLALGYVRPAALHGEHKTFVSEDADSPQHRVTANAVLLFQRGT
jgi:hypothetical protein